tara:strand:+ start:190 stop:1257 length:1068 start_codon:yes stop_codon:yes gene_type:complete
MTPADFVKKIKNYAVVSFVLPLIAINSCLLLYKYMGDLKIDAYPNLNWNQAEHAYTFDKYNLKDLDFNIRSINKSHRFAFCPKHNFDVIFTTIDDQILSDSDTSRTRIESLLNSNKIKSIIIKEKKSLNQWCIKNYKSYTLVKKFSWIDKILVQAKMDNTAGFAKIKNPYFYGEVSISRTARFFPSIIIFKSLIILSALLLFLYWKNNFNLFHKLKSINILNKFSKKFFYFGLLSCLFLILHATFLGIDSDSKLFSIMRKIIIVLFILFELFAQIFLTINLFKFKSELKKYINPLILKIKIIFVTIVIVVTLITFIILAFFDPSSMFKHVMEWNYFSYLLIYYLLSRLLWRKIHS